MGVTAPDGVTDVTETSTFYDLWQAFVTIRGMCVRYGSLGKIYGVGSKGGMTAITQPYILH